MEFPTCQFKVGDKVAHLYAPCWRGTVTRIDGPYGPYTTHGAEELHFRIHWKGWDKNNPEREIWDYECCLTHA